MAAKEKVNELMFRGRPVVRRDNCIYYGFIDDKVIAKLTVKEAEDINDIKLSTKINVQLITNNTHLTGNEIMIMMKTRDGIYEALDLAAVWLDDALDN